MAALTKYDPTSPSDDRHLLEFVVNRCILKLQARLANSKKLWDKGICSVLRTWSPGPAEIDSKWVTLPRFLQLFRHESVPHRGKIDDTEVEWELSDASLQGWALTLVSIFEILETAVAKRIKHPSDVAALVEATNAYAALCDYVQSGAAETLLTSKSLTSRFERERITEPREYSDEYDDNDGQRR